MKYLFKEMLSIELDKSSIEKIEYSIERLTKLKYKKQPFLHLTNYGITLDKNFKVDDDVRLILKDYLQYGFFTYKKEFDPNLINREIDLYLYEQYKRTDVLALIGYNKAIDSLREGVLQYKGNYYLFVNLFKDEEAKENKLNYQDYFINNSKFHWQSQNQTSQSSPTGQNLIHHVKNNKKVHLFVRREKKEEGVVMPFYYVGELEFVSASGNKPISIEWNLKKEIPMKLLNEFTVNNEGRY
nr:DUF3427 domain-containing protein [Macrococcus caseolyticus]